MHGDLVLLGHLRQVGHGQLDGVLDQAVDLEAVVAEVVVAQLVPFGAVGQANVVGPEVRADVFALVLHLGGEVVEEQGHCFAHRGVGEALE